MASGNTTNAQFYASLRCQFNFFSFSLGEIDGPLKKYYTIFFFQKSDTLLYLMYFLHHNRTQKPCLLILVSTARSCPSGNIPLLLSPRREFFSDAVSGSFSLLWRSSLTGKLCVSTQTFRTRREERKQSWCARSDVPLSSPHGTGRNHLCDYKNDDLPKESLVTILYKSNGDVCVFPVCHNP